MTFGNWSSDNGIIVKKIGDKWYVKDNASFSIDHIDEYIEQTKYSFNTREEALIKAHDLQKLGYYEYNVIEY